MDESIPVESIEVISAGGPNDGGDEANSDNESILVEEHIPQAISP